MSRDADVLVVGPAPDYEPAVVCGAFHLWVMGFQT
jgi:hypothetical protein